MTPEADSPRHDAYAALRHREFRWYILSLFAITLASQLQAVVVGWQVYAITHDPLSLGLLGLAEALPFIAVALPAGYVADRWNRRTIAVCSLAVNVACAAALLAFSATPGLLDRVGVMPIYGIIFVSGIARSLLQPARQAFGAEIIPRSMYENAITWRSSSWQTAAVVGPAKPYSSPPTAGPTTAAVCHVLLRQAMAFSYIARGMISAPRAWRAGCSRLRAMPLTKITA